MKYILQPKKSEYISPLSSNESSAPIVASNEIREWTNRDLARAFELSSISNNGRFSDVNTYVSDKKEIKTISDFSKDKIFVYPFHKRKSVQEINGGAVSDIVKCDEYALFSSSKNKIGKDANEIINNYKGRFWDYKKSFIV